MTLIPSGGPFLYGGSPLAPLRAGPFRHLWLATLLANAGGWAQIVGAAWLMLELAGRADLVAYVQAAHSAPVLFLSLLAGAFADTYERRSLQLRAQMWVFTGAVLMILATALDAVNPFVILLSTFLVGIGMAMRAPAWHASIRDLVPDEDVAAAVTLSSVGFNLSRIAGPAIGGLIIGYSSPIGAFAFNAAVSLVLIAVLMRMMVATEKRKSASVRNMIESILGGITYVLAERPIRTVLVRAAGIGIPASATLALLPVFVRSGLSGGATQYGALLGCFGAGAVTSAFVLTGWRRSFHSETLLSAATMAYALSLGLLAVTTSFLIASVALFLGGLCWVVMLTTLNTSVQLLARSEFRGRALAAYMTCAFGGLMVGSILWGGVAQSMGLSVAFASAASALSVSLLLRLGFSLPTMRG